MLRRTALRAIPAAIALLTATACGYGSQAGTTSAAAAAKTGAAGAPAATTKTSAGQVRLGYFANLTHATALVGLQQGFFHKQLGRTAIKQQVFNAGPAEIEALNSGAIDLGYIGPSPAINGYLKSHGKSLRIIAGATSGGASLVVNPKKIHSISDLPGHRLATPQLGNTQDVALRTWLKQRGWPVDRSGRGKVTVQPTDNAELLTAFQRGDIDGAWVPEPWASRLVVEAGAKPLLDEKSLWPGGKFVTTNLIVSQTFLKAHPDTVAAVLRGQIAANAWIQKNPAAAKKTVNARLAALSGKPLKPAVLDRAWQELTVTDDPLAATLRTQAAHAKSTGFVTSTDLKGIYDLAPLNKALAAAGQPAVTDAGLG
ncbi:sulfate ABC transporter substrate-binding protein [Mangrovactinospora gilvigrisea]|uniref:Sulfate ABC transporter substrate-binding protein n=1 Tax=Mangrovactinospora gilvigrisea TaxID=1428644 RepID=A0A1J7C5W3_9ACTN|nr:ABC transporter substrate-binding protein [Mangrovactinospora gilvigrisea]OIV36936.1 sulfate ABC transporter substrate-binding protein [Mangrovactinospora gilvigrisea]